MLDNYIFFLYPPLCPTSDINLSHPLIIFLATKQKDDSMNKICAIGHTGGGVLDIHETYVGHTWDNINRVLDKIYKPWDTHGT